MPHSTVRVYQPWIRNDFGNGEVDVVSVAYPNRDATIPGKSPMNLGRKKCILILVNLVMFRHNTAYYIIVGC